MPRKPHGFTPTELKPGKKSVTSGPLEGLQPTSHPTAGRPRTATRTSEEQLFGEPRRVGESQSRTAIRQASPTQSLRDAAQAKLPINSPDPVFPGRVVDGPAQADHIIALDKIRQKPGFAAIADESRQIEILNHAENFEPLSPFANQSKGNKSYAEWAADLRAKGTPFNEDYMNSMIAKEQELDAVIEQMIRDSKRWGEMPTP
jgi:hypothetical protein